jgi:glucose/arabinose dehydrogenase
MVKIQAACKVLFRYRVLSAFFIFITFQKNLCAQLPAGFTVNLVQDGYEAPVGVIFSADGTSMFTWEKAGRIYVSKWNGSSYVKQTAAVLDISEEVGNWSDFGLLSVCLDPDFDQNGLIYLYYVVDRHHLIYSGTAQYNPASNDYFKATISRVTRYKLNTGTAISTDYSTRKILIGETKKTGIPLLQVTHAGGTLVFGKDKTLLLSAGEGASANSTDTGSAAESYYQQALLDSIIRPEENAGAFRAQMLNSHSGKILRFDPATGNGIASNPFYNTASPRSPRSRVWAMGLRNPFRMCIQPNTGSTNPADANPGILAYGEVGYSTWEEINIVKTGGLNLGWPLYEGQTENTAYYTSNAINKDEGQLFKSLCLQPTSFATDQVVTKRRFTHYRPALAWNHKASDARIPSFNGTTPVDLKLGDAGTTATGQSFFGNCAIGGLFYTGTAFGPAYENKYFFADYGVNFIKTITLNSTEPWVSDVAAFAPYDFGKGIVYLTENPLDGSVYYVNIITGEIQRISSGSNLPPIAAISSNVNNGVSPLTVNFSSAGSSDPNGGTLTYAWDFGDGTKSALPNPSHTFSGQGISSYKVTLTVTNSIALSSTGSLVISINNTAPSAHISNPVNNYNYAIINETDIPLSATVTDNESTAGMKYVWQVILRHNNHEHPEPEITGDPSPTVTISPIGCDGETYYYVILLSVTDNGGLTAKDSVKIYPNCASGAGLSVTDLFATQQSVNSTVLLTWKNPAVVFDEVMVAVRSDTGFLSNPTGVSYIADADYKGAGTLFEKGKIVYRGTGQSVTITGLKTGVAYYFRVFTRKDHSWTGGVETTINLPATLKGSGILSSTEVNLSEEGKTDWVHWPGYIHKLTGGAKISNFNTIGFRLPVIYNNDLRTWIWNDGTPVKSGSNQSGVFKKGKGGGFQITAPADLTLRILKVYVGGLQSGGRLAAQLSDGSSADYTDVSFSGSDRYNAEYTIVYTAAAKNKFLSVRWVQASGGGNVSLQAATLVQIKATGVSVTPSSANIVVNSTLQLQAKVIPEMANQNVYWSSSNTAVAAVTGGGLVTALSKGTATITATSLDGDFKATCTILCTIPVTGVTVSPPIAIVPIDSIKYITATVAPVDASDKNVVWSSSNPEAASVNANGMVTGLFPGAATITAKTTDGNFIASSIITVPTISSTFTVFPNPFQGNFTARYSGKEKGKGTILLYNAEMRIINKYDFNKTAWKLSQQIESSTLPGGMYIVEINLGSVKYLKRILKIR